jgi:hypothetical protein
MQYNIKKQEMQYITQKILKIVLIMLFLFADKQNVQFFSTYLQFLDNDKIKNL